MRSEGQARGNTGAVFLVGREREKITCGTRDPLAWDPIRENQRRLQRGSWATWAGRVPGNWAPVRFWRRWLGCSWVASHAALCRDLQPDDAHVSTAEDLVKQLPEVDNRAAKGYRPR